MKTTNTLHKLTYRVMRYDLERGPRFIGLAWDYDKPALISTQDYETYAGARVNLDRNCEALGCVPHWFDGDYKFDKRSGQLLPMD